MNYFANWSSNYCWYDWVYLLGQKQKKERGEQWLIELIFTQTLPLSYKQNEKTKRLLINERNNE